MSIHTHNTTLSGKINIQKEESWIARNSMKIGDRSIDSPYCGKTLKSTCPFCHSHNVLIDEKLILTDRTIVAMANEKLALANETMAMANEKLALANETMAMANEKLALANKATAMAAGNKDTKWSAVAGEIGKLHSTNPSPAPQETEHNPLIEDSPSITLRDGKDKGPGNARSEGDGYHQLHDPKTRDRFLRAQRFFDDLKEGITSWGPKEWEESRHLIEKLLLLCCPSNHKEKTKDSFPLNGVTSLMFHHDGGSILMRALIGLLKNAWIPEIDPLTDPKNWKPVVEDLCNLRMRVDRTLHCLKYPQDEGNGVYHRGYSTLFGELDLEVPRTRWGFSPYSLPRYQSAKNTLKDFVYRLYLPGLSLRKISKLLEEGFNLRTPPETLSQWLQPYYNDAIQYFERDLSTTVYTAIGMDTLFVPIREEGRYVSKAIAVSTGITAEGRRDIIGITPSPDENVESYDQHIGKLKERGLNVNDIRIVTTDGHRAFPLVVRKHFPHHTVHQRCYVHAIRNIMNAAPKSMKKEMAKDASYVLRSGDMGQALERWSECAGKYRFGNKATCEAWERLSPKKISLSLQAASITQNPILLPYILSTNYTESLNALFRERTNSKKGGFVSLEVAMKELMLTAFYWVGKQKENPNPLPVEDLLSIPADYESEISNGEPLPTTAYDFHPLLCTEQGRGCMDDVHTLDF
ncbi:IS256 family transposase [Pasteuria penetrans]|uniref:IS256 family transposase n=1 Tax=Pasteuria penetrans TaxID=86005 RepID=UPI000F9DAF20|nr:transposase [Pasteuria penetrans]